MNNLSVGRRFACVVILSGVFSTPALAGIITTTGDKTEQPPPPPPASSTTQNDGADSTTEASETSETSGLVETATGLWYSAVTGLYYATLSYF